MIRVVFAVTVPIPLYRIVMENGDSTAEEHSCDRMTDDPEFDDKSRYIRRARRPSIYSAWERIASSYISFDLHLILLSVLF